MNYCINPECKQRQNIDNLEYCQSCGTPLLINARYRLVKPLRQLDLRNPTDIFEVDDKGTRKVMKVLKDSSTKLMDLLEQEANVLQWLKHPGIPKVEIDGYFTFLPNNSTQEIHCLVMEKIDGDNLEQWLEKYSSISQELALNWLRQIIEIIDYVHKQGFFHRDIKPSNIMVRPNGKLALIDFGSVREITNTYLVKISGGSGEGIGSDITGIISTGYTPMEQVNGRAVPQSDFYALGRTFIRLLTGKSLTDLPINSETGRIIWRKQALQVSKPLADFIDDLMAPFPGERPQNAEVILQRLSTSGMVMQSILRLFGSPKVRRRIKVLLILGFTGLGLFLLLASLLAQQSLNNLNKTFKSLGNLKSIDVFKVLNQYYSNKGLESLETADLERAKRNYEQALKFNPDDVDAHNNLGFICQQLKDFICAENQYKQVLKTTPDDAITHINLGLLYEDIKQPDRARDQYKFAVKNSSGDEAAIAISNLTRLEIISNQKIRCSQNGACAVSIDVDIGLIQQGLQQTQNSTVKSALYKNRGWILYLQGNYDKAENDLRQAIDLDKKFVAAHCLLALVLEAKSDKKKALIAWKECLDSGSEDIPDEVKGWQSIASQRLNEARNNQ